MKAAQAACELDSRAVHDWVTHRESLVCRKHMIVHRDLKPANLMLGGIPHETGTREMVCMLEVS